MKTILFICAGVLSVGCMSMTYLAVRNSDYKNVGKIQLMTWASLMMVVVAFNI